MDTSTNREDKVRTNGVGKDKTQTNGMDKDNKETNGELQDKVNNKEDQDSVSEDLKQFSHNQMEDQDSILEDLNRTRTHLEYN